MQVSQGSATADLRWGGRFHTIFLSSRSENTTVKELLKSVYIRQSYCKNKSGTRVASPACETCSPVNLVYIIKLLL